MNEKNVFLLSTQTKIATNWISRPIERAIQRFYRDIKMTLEASREDETKIQIEQADMPEESYEICIASQESMVIKAADELGVIYALIYISCEYMRIQPFWFWNDQVFNKKEKIKIPFGMICSKERKVRFRGWFINDEVLLANWTGGISKEYPWEMAMEALLRCGGNMVIPGTDKNSKIYGPLAADMGLWITQHHAEPLGAEMFLRAWPEKEPSFQKYPELFRQLWEEGVKRQKDWKVIWNLGFRGQGDTPFWELDPQYDTPQKRGSLISSIMMEQYEIVSHYVKDPVFCVNLYGEVMELYNQGCITLPDNVIMIWADNGYGKMVSRRQWNHDPRIPSLPPVQMAEKKHGVYYHASFYDLQAANVLTVIPNSMEFVGRELKNAYTRGIKEFWLVNCSNVKPHVYTLSFIASMWNGEEKTALEHLHTYLKKYYPLKTVEYPEIMEQLLNSFRNYFKMLLPYGKEEDQHAGEQFYNYVTRVMIHHWMKTGGKGRCEELNWCALQKTFEEQVGWYGKLCQDGLPAMKKELEEVMKLEEEAGQLWKDSISLQVKIHTYCCVGAVLFSQAFEDYKKEKYMDAFYKLGLSAEWYEKADQAMQECCHDKWIGFYDNDCQTDICETAYLLRQLMGYVRNTGDGPYFYNWQREVLYSPGDRKILLLTNEERHMTDQEMFEKMKEINGIHEN